MERHIGSQPESKTTQQETVRLEPGRRELTETARRFGEWIAGWNAGGRRRYEVESRLRFGRWIRSTRLQQQGSMESFAKQCGISVEFLILLESGLACSKEIAAIQDTLLEELGLDLADFINGPGNTGLGCD